jgi:hypothetical protein
MAYPGRLERQATLLTRAAAVILLSGAVALLVRPRLVETITGVRHAPELTSPDELPALSKDDATPFFQSRNQLEIRVAEATTLRAFLDRNRLNKPFHRRQIATQLGSDSPDAPIAAGTLFKIALTPVAEDVPGAKPK